MLERMDAHDLGRFCKGAVRALEALDAIRTLKLLADRLDRTVYLAHAASHGAIGSTRGSWWWCDDLEHLGHNDDVRALLAVATNGVATRTAAQDDTSAARVWQTLARYSGDIFDRIRLDVLASAGRFLQDQLDAVVGGDTLLDPEHTGRAAAALLRAQFSNASPAARRLLRYALERGPAPERVHAALRWRHTRLEVKVQDGDGGAAPSGNDDATVEASAPAAAEDGGLPVDPQVLGTEVQESVEHWQRRHLRWFHDHIPDELGALAQRLSVVPQVPSRHEQALDEGWVYYATRSASAGSQSKPESLDSLDSKQLVEFLETWKPGEEDFETFARRGLEEALSAYASAQPQNAVAAVELGRTASLPEEYITALLSGLHGAAEAGLAVPWERVVAVAHLIASSADAVATTRGGSERADDRQPDGRSWRGDPLMSLRLLVRAVVDLVEKACANEWIPEQLSEAVWQYADAAVRSRLTWTDGPGSAEISSFGDIVSASAGTLGGEVTDMVINVALWDYRRLTRGHPEEVQDAPVPEVATRLEPLVDHIVHQTGRGALGAQALLGIYVPQLFLLTPDWVRANQSLLFEEGARVPMQRPAWGGYITRAGFYDPVFREMRHWYSVAAQAAAARGSDEREDAWSLTKGLGVHVLTAVLRGLCNVGDPDAVVETTFSSIPLKERTHAYWVIFRRWSDAETSVSPESVSHLVTFWEWRVGELEGGPSVTGREEEADGLAWFLATPFVPIADAIRLGYRSAALASGERRTRVVAWERIGKIAEEEPAASFELTELLVRQALESEYVDLPFEEVAPALRAALACDHASIRRRAERLVHSLGDRGLFEFGELIASADA